MSNNSMSRCLLLYVLLALSTHSFASDKPDAASVYPISTEEAVLLASQAMQSIGYKTVHADGLSGFVQGTRDKQGSATGALFIGGAAKMIEKHSVIDVYVKPVRGGVLLDLWARKAKNLDRDDHKKKDERKFRQAFEHRLSEYQFVAPRVPSEPNLGVRNSTGSGPARSVAMLRFGEVICTPNPVARGQELELVIQILAADPSQTGPKMPVQYQYSILKDGKKLFQSEDTVLAALNGEPTARTERFVVPGDPGTYRFDFTITSGDHSVTTKAYVEVN